MTFEVWRLASGRLGNAAAVQAVPKLAAAMPARIQSFAAIASISFMVFGGTP
jgi:hypothetical protein